MIFPGGDHKWSRESGITASNSKPDKHSDISVDRQNPSRTTPQLLVLLVFLQPSSLNDTDGYTVATITHWRGSAGISGQGPHFTFTVVINEFNKRIVTFSSFSCAWSTAVGMLVASHLEKAPTLPLEQPIARREIMDGLPGIPLSKQDLIDIAIDAALRLESQCVHTH